MQSGKILKHIRILKDELTRRKSINPRYSLRAFSHCFGIHPSALSRILQGKQELSAGAAEKIFNKMIMSTVETQEFIDSIVEEKRHRTASALTQAAIKSRSILSTETQMGISS